jgi:hypothetical protein
MNEQASIILVKVGKVNKSQILFLSKKKKKSQILLYCTRQDIVGNMTFFSTNSHRNNGSSMIMIMKTHSTYRD